MQRHQVNPWDWQDSRGYSQAWRVDGATSLVFLAGQCPIDADGELVAPDDFGAQTRQTLVNLRTVLERSGATLADVVRLGVYLTDITKLPELGRVKAEFFTGPQPSSTAVAVSALAIPQMMVEIDAIAALAFR